MTSRRNMLGILICTPAAVALAGCENGHLTESARDKLSRTLDVIRGVNDGVKVTLAGYHIACQNNSSSKACTNALVIAAALALEAGSAIVTDALVVAQAALDDKNAPEDKIVTATSALQDAYGKVEQLIDQFSAKQKVELGNVVFAYRPMTHHEAIEAMRIMIRTQPTRHYTASGTLG